MKFSKLHGTGNDYIYVDCFREQPGDPASLSVRLSDRHFGVGADGLILVCPSQSADFKMRMFNSHDGSEAQMCGNGIRAFGKYVFDKGLTDKTILTVETKAGVKNLTLNVANGRVTSVRVDMGEPVLLAADIPVAAVTRDFINRPVAAGGDKYLMTCVNMGNPHAVTFVDDVDALDLPRVGPILENNPIFPERANIEFVQVIDDRTLKMRVWERGSGETLACGTGACASLVASVLNGKTQRRAKLILLGGELDIDWNDSTGRVYMTGPATFVFDGEIEI